MESRVLKAFDRFDELVGSSDHITSQLIEDYVCRLDGDENAYLMLVTKSGDGFMVVGNSNGVSCQKLADGSAIDLVRTTCQQGDSLVRIGANQEMQIANRLLIPKEIAIQVLQELGVPQGYDWE